MRERQQLTDDERRAASRAAARKALASARRSNEWLRKYDESPNADYETPVGGGYGYVGPWSV